MVVTRKTLEFCASRKWNYRVSSGMMPLETLPEANLVLENAYNFNLIKQEFDIAAEVIRKNNIRCSTHPDQFVVPASANVQTVAKSIIELHAHGKMMDSLMELSLGDYEEYILQWLIDSQWVKRRIVPPHLPTSACIGAVRSRGVYEAVVACSNRCV